MFAHQTCNNNGQACAREAKFCGNATNESDSLLDDLRFQRRINNLRGKKERRLSLRPRQKLILVAF
jgi:hypothetical protein